MGICTFYCVDKREGLISVSSALKPLAICLGTGWDLPSKHRSSLSQAPSLLGVGHDVYSAHPFPGHSTLGDIPSSQVNFKTEKFAIYESPQVFLPRKPHGQRNLAGYSPWGCKRVGDDLATKQQKQGAHPFEVLAALEVPLSACYQQGQARFKASLTWGLEKPLVGAESDQHAGLEKPSSSHPCMVSQRSIHICGVWPLLRVNPGVSWVCPSSSRVLTLHSLLEEWIPAFTGDSHDQGTEKNAYEKLHCADVKEREGQRWTTIVYKIERCFAIFNFKDSLVPNSHLLFLELLL